MQKIELEKKLCKILNIAFDSTLSLFLLPLKIYEIISKLYLAIFIKKSIL